MLVAVLTVFFVVTAALAGPARAATFKVINTNDSGDGSLRKAINTANTNGQADTITFDLSESSTIILTSGELEINQGGGELTIEGPGAKALSVSGNGESRVFKINDRAEATISGLTITEGGGGFQDAGTGISNLGVLTVEDSTITGNSSSYGGGIHNAKSEETVEGGTLIVKNSIISGNTASGYTTSSGGGIRNDGGTLTVIGSTITGNTADRGGGISSDISLPGQTSTITNSTISGNFATGRGGGVYNHRGLTAIEYSTITNNTAPEDLGSGVAIPGGESPRTEVSSSIIADNPGTDVDLISAFSDPPNSFTSEGYNVIGDGEATDAFDAPGDQVNVSNPGLQALADNGGPTKTHALQRGSPAIDGGSSNCPPPATDQRGVDRPQGGGCDTGSFELQGGTTNDPPVADDGDGEESGQDGPCAGAAEEVGAPEFYFIYVPELNGCAMFAEGIPAPYSLIQANALVYDAATGEELGLLKDLVDLSANPDYFSEERFSGNPDPDYSTESYCGAFPLFDEITAQDYYDGVENGIAGIGWVANAQEQAILDPNGDGVACTAEDLEFAASDGMADGGDGEEPGQDDPQCIDGILDRNGDGQISPIEAAQAGADATQGKACPGTGDEARDTGANDETGSQFEQTWTGQITETGEDGTVTSEYGVEADIMPITEMTEDLVGEVVGEVSYSLDCSGIWVLEEVNEDSVQVEEQIKKGLGNCVEFVPLTLTPQEDGTLKYYYPSSINGNIGRGVLSRQGSSAPDGIMDGQQPGDGQQPAPEAGEEPAPKDEEPAPIVYRTDAVTKYVADSVRDFGAYCADTMADTVGDIRQGRLPDTGGGRAVLLFSGTALIGGGWFLVRRFSR